MRIDPDTGLTNYQLMRKGRAPFWEDGTVVELHHLIQREPGSMVELPYSLHKAYDKILHGLVENGGSFKNDSQRLLDAKEAWEEEFKIDN